MIKVFLRPVKRYSYLPSLIKSVLNFSAKLIPWPAASLFLTMTTWLEVVYGIVKSIFFLRSSVTVIPDIPISTLPEDTAVMIESNSISSTESFMPR